MPSCPAQAKPAHLGLVASDDGGNTWIPVGLSGQADFHALSAAGATIYGFDSLSTAVMRSDDGGQRWQQGASFAMTDLDVDPDNPMHVISATSTGLRESYDGGMTFTADAQHPVPRHHRLRPPRRVRDLGRSCPGRARDRAS